MGRRTNQDRRIGRLNQSLRQRNKVKGYAIAQLSNELVSLSDRLQEIERSRKWRL
jgi:hypothetical protein